MGRWLLLAVAFSLGLGTGYVLFGTKRTLSTASSPAIDSGVPQTQISHAIQEPLQRSNALRPESQYVKLGDPEKKGTTSASAVLEQARQAIGSGRPEKAVELIKSELEKDPNNSELLIEMANLQSMWLGQDEEAIVHLQKAMDQGGDSRAIQTLLMIALNPQRKNAEAKATEILQKKAEQNPEDFDIQIAWGDYLAAKGKTKEALPIIEKWVKQGHEEASYRLVDLYFQANQPDKAMEWVAHFRKNAEAKYQRTPSQASLMEYTHRTMLEADYLSRGGRIQEAMELLRPLQEKNRDYLPLQRFAEQLRTQADQDASVDRN